MKEAIYSFANLKVVDAKISHSVQLSTNSPIVEIKSNKIYKIKNKVIILPKINTTPITVEKKVFIMHIRSKGLIRSIIYSDLTCYLAPKIQIFLMNIIIVIPEAR